MRTPVKRNSAFAVETGLRSVWLQQNRRYTWARAARRSCRNRRSFSTAVRQRAVIALAQPRIMHCAACSGRTSPRARSIEHVRTTYVPRLGACDRLVHQSVVVVPVAATVGIMVPVAGTAAQSANPLHSIDCGAHCGVAAA